MKNSNAKKIAVCSILAALSVAILLLSSLVVVGFFAGALLSSVSLIIISAEYGKRPAFATYCVISALSLMLLPEKDAAIVFICFAWYAILRDSLKKGPKAIQIIIKIVCYALAVSVMLWITIKILGLEISYIMQFKYAYIGVILAGLFVFFLLDPVYNKFERVWKEKWRRLLSL